MTNKEAIALIKNEIQCVLTQRNCKRDCEHCPLIKPEGDIKEAFEMAIEALQEQKTGRWIYNPYYVCHECSECGEQALEEFTVNERTLDRDYDEVLSEYCPHCGSRMLEIEDEEEEEEDD